MARRSAIATVVACATMAALSVRCDGAQHKGYAEHDDQPGDDADDDAENLFSTCFPLLL